MSILYGSARAALVLALSAGLSVVVAGSALADAAPTPNPVTPSTVTPPAPQQKTTPGPPPSTPVLATADYAIGSYTSVLVGDPVDLYETHLSPPDATVTRQIDWGDGSPVQAGTTAGPWHHAYAKAGVFHLSVEVVSGSDDTPGNFPEGNAVTILASVPPDVLSGQYSLHPAQVAVHQPVTLTEDKVQGDDAPPVFIFRRVYWGDGTYQDFSRNDAPTPHRYAKAGRYQVSVRLTNLQWHVLGTFPAGNVVTVTGPSSTGGATGGNGAGGAAGDGGGLPITGPDTAVVGGVGLGLLLAGAVTLVALRRRRIHFVR